MTNQEIKERLEELCKEYPEDIAMAAYSVLGANELYDGIPVMLEDYEDMF